MRVILDANIFISALLSRNEGSNVKKIVRTCLLVSEIQLVFPTELKGEMVSVWEHKKPLQKLITRQELDALLREIELVAEVPPSIEQITAYSRDPHDDYLIAYGLVEQADYLITGDADLTVLKQIKNLKIISPIDFFAIVEGLEG